MESSFRGLRGWGLIQDSLFVVLSNGNILQWAVDVSTSTEEKESLTNTIKIYPNPFTEGFRIDHPFKMVRVDVLDLQGKLVRSYPMVERNKFIQPELDQPGVYVLRIHGGASIRNMKIIFPKKNNYRLSIFYLMSSGMSYT